jgi:hypothetical protein
MLNKEENSRSANLSDRFAQLNAPAEFRPELNIPLRWRCSHRRPDYVAMYDPSCATGFALRVWGEDIDVAFHLDGRISRMMVERQVIDDPEEQDRVLQSLLM